MQDRWKKWGIRIGLIVGGVASALLVVFVASALFLPDTQERPDNENAGIIEFKVEMGDLFIAQQGSIKPPNNPEDVLSRYPLAWGEDGFRVPAQPADDYEIVAIGDSYTEAPNVAKPWPDVLAQSSGRTVRNLGFRGYGPQETLAVLQEYGVETEPNVVVLGFFGGNDLENAATFSERSDNFVLPEFTQQAISDMIASGDPWNTDSDVYQYPVSLSVDDTPMELAFFNNYVSALNIPIDALRQSENLNILRDNWQAIHETVDDDTCVLIAYFPSKAHIYLPYVLPEDRSNIIAGQAEMILDDNSLLTKDYNWSPDWDEIMSRRHNLPTVLGELAAEEGYNFLNLVPVFEEAASQGEKLYYKYDTHWNQAGHNVAGRAINTYLDEIGC